MIWLIVGSTVPSLLITFALAFVVRRYATSWGLIDRPGDHATHSRPIPMGGGLAIWAGVMIPLAIGSVVLAVLAHYDKSSADVPLIHLFGSKFSEFVDPHLPGLARQSAKLWMLLGGATVMMVLGLIDDRRNLDWRLRIVVQTLVACLMVWQGWQISFFVDLPILTTIASVLWIVGLINTFNMLDNMDGLSAGIAAIAAAILAAVILSAPEPITHGPQLFVGGFLLVLVGALLGFLWHNRPAARLFMGDAGSYFVGFCIATATMAATFAGEGLPRHSILAPLCVLAIPLYDTCTVIWIRISTGKSPFAADRNHISHRLVDLGLSRTQAIVVLYAATAACGVGAFMLHRTGGTGAIVILTGIGILLLIVAWIELGIRRRKRFQTDAETEA